jgi:WD40 repeat protein
VYTGSGDCTIRSYDAKSGDVKKVFIGHDFAVTALEVTTAFNSSKAWWVMLLYDV